MRIIGFFFLLMFSGNIKAATYYIAVNGNDKNSGDILSPFATFERLNNVDGLGHSLTPGDIVYIHGGTYLSSATANSNPHFKIEKLHGISNSLINIWAFPGEKPVFDLTNINTTNANVDAFLLMNCDYINLKGIRITGLKQVQNGLGVSIGLEINNVNNTIIELVEVDHMGGTGFKIVNCLDLHVLNCDSHHNDDRHSAKHPWGGADGFGITQSDNNSDRIVFEGCRAYLNSDDGWDNFKTDGKRIFKNCWAFNNGKYQDSGMMIPRPAGIDGNGEGFKLGPFTHDKTGTDTLRIVENCLSFCNRDNGFDQNGTPTTRYQLHNNVSYKNGADGFQFQYYNPMPVNHIFKNNISYKDAGLAINYPGLHVSDVNNNWNKKTVINDTYFQSLDSTGVSGSREADGSLPDIPFLKPVH